VIADGLGRAVAFILAPGQAHELPHAIPLLERLPGVPKWGVADRGFSSHAFREHIWQRGARPAIPSKQNEAPVCAVPESRGALSRDEEDVLWQEFYTAAPAQRREFEPSSKRRKKRPASLLPATD
jgi:Transposase DDE domain